MTNTLIVLLFVVGVSGVLMCDHLIRKIMSLSIMNSGIIIFFVHLGSEQGKEAPIMLEAVTAIADPVPQALMLTAIVVGV